MSKSSPQIIVKSYDHFNRSFGKHISSKKEYQEEMARGGYVTFEKGESLANKHKREHTKDYTVEKDTRQFINALKFKTPDKNGKIKLSTKEIDFMKKKGVNYDENRKPEGSSMKGGFNE